MAETIGNKAAELENAQAPLLIQILPRFTPGRCGVTDHATTLADQLLADHAIETRYAVLGSAIAADDAVCGVTLEHLPGLIAELATGRKAGVLLHMSGYGYSADGAPTRLAQQWLAIDAGKQYKTAVYFHELFAMGPPWRKHFWYSWRQRAAMRQFSAHAEMMLTNTGKHAAWLRRKNPDTHSLRLHQMPVFSTIGESLAYPAAAREPALVILGLPGTRARAYAHLKAHPGLVSLLGIDRVLDVGPEFDAPRQMDGIQVERQGVVPASELAALLRRVRFGFAGLPPNALAKSSVFANYCANGTIAVTTTAFAGELDGLMDGRELLSPGSLNRAASNGWDAMSKAGWSWYQGHRASVHAALYSDWLR